MGLLVRRQLLLGGHCSDKSREDKINVCGVANSRSNNNSLLWL